MENAMNNKNDNGHTSRKNNGAVLLVSYADSKFKDLLKKNSGAYILDAREKGWSANAENRSDTLKAEFGKRYTLTPSLAIANGDTDEDWVNKIVPAIEKIVQVIESGKSVIITTFNMTQLKLIGHYIMCAKHDANVWLRWENTQTNTSGMSRQRMLKPQALTDAVDKLFARFEAKGDASIETNDNPFANL